MKSDGLAGDVLNPGRTRAPRHTVSLNSFSAASLARPCSSADSDREFAITRPVPHLWAVCPPHRPLQDAVAFDHSDVAFSHSKLLDLLIGKNTVESIVHLRILK